MEKNLLLTDDLLWDYADNLLDSAERRRVTEALYRQPDAAYRLEAILSEKKAFAAQPLDLPATGFADRVLSAWTLEQMQLQPRTKPGRDWMVLLISGGFGLLLLVPLLALVIAALRNSAAVLPIDYRLPAINWAALLSNSALQYALGLAFTLITLRLLDRYLQHEKALQLA